MTRYRLDWLASTAFVFLSSCFRHGGGSGCRGLDQADPLPRRLDHEGCRRASLIVEGAASPHYLYVEAVNAQALENADVVFWVGPGLEAFLDKRSLKLCRRKPRWWISSRMHRD